MTMDMCWVMNASQTMRRKLMGRAIGCGVSGQNRS